jgi:autotransporter-associated beta strand protein/T5SS/PEP-CTERM-associated repeat protein
MHLQILHANQQLYEHVLCSTRTGKMMRFKPEAENLSRLGVLAFTAAFVATHAQAAGITTNSNVTYNSGTGTITFASGTPAGVMTIDDAALDNSSINTSINSRGTIVVTGSAAEWRAGRIFVNDGTLTITSDGCVIGNQDIIVGDTYGAAATLTISDGGSLEIDGQFNLAVGGSAVATISNGGTLSTHQGYVGNSNSTVATDTHADMTITGALSRWTIANYDLGVGNNSIGTLTIEDGATVSVLTADRGSLLGSGVAGSQGIININSSGALEVGSIQSHSTSSAMNLDGGIIRATQSTGEFAHGFASGSFVLQSGGGTFDTQSFDIATTLVMSGVGSLTKTGSGQLTLTGAQIYTGNTVINAGTLELGDGGKTGSIHGNVVNNGILAFNRSDSVTFSGVVSGVGGIHQIGSGKTDLTGDSFSLLGESRIMNGVLAVNGNLGGRLMVQTGRLQGNGTVGTTTLMADGVIAPGNSIGQLTVNGDFIGAGGTLEIETVLGDDSSATDKLIVTGNTSGQTNVRVLNDGGAGAPTTDGIKIIEVGGTSSGTFDLLGDYIHMGEQAVVAGAYAYKIKKGRVSTPSDGDWYLRSSLISSPLYQGGVPTYEAYPKFLLGLNTLPTYRQRVGDRAWFPTSDNDQSSHNVMWGRIDGNHASITQAVLRRKLT